MGKVRGEGWGTGRGAEGVGEEATGADGEGDERGAGAGGYGGFDLGDLGVRGGFFGVRGGRVHGEMRGGACGGCWSTAMSAEGEVGVRGISRGLEECGACGGNGLKLRNLLAARCGAMWGTR